MDLSNAKVGGYTKAELRRIIRNLEKTIAKVNPRHEWTLSQYRLSLAYYQTALANLG